VEKQEGTDPDVKIRVSKVRASFLQLKEVWTSKYLSTNTKIGLFNSNVKSVLLHGAETWRTTVNTTKEIQTFTSNCLRRILPIRWPENISNEELWERTKMWRSANAAEYV
jgi:hypothetical protein